MADDVPIGFSLKRWSRRKLEAARLKREPSAPPVVGTADCAQSPPVIGTAASPATAQSPTPGAATSPSAVPEPSARPPEGGLAPAWREGAQRQGCTHELPPISSLSFESDFSAFLQPKVDEGLKREALKKLFSDPRFNVMDGLDTYIDDYSKPDPISAELIREMTQSRYIFDPPQTRINAEGFAEDVPVDEKVAPVDASDANDATRVASATPAAASPPDALPSPPSAAAMPAMEVPAVAQSIPEPENGAGVAPSSPAQSRSR